MFHWFHCMLDIAIPYPIEPTFPTEVTVPQTGEMVTLLNEANLVPVLLLLVVLILMSVGIVYFFMIKKKLAASDPEVTAEEKKE